MTGDASAAKGGVIHCRYRDPRRHRMTGITFLRSGNMSRTFTLCDNIIVATRAHTYHFIMIHGVGIDRRPGIDPMAGITHSSAIDVCRTFALRYRAIVATHAAANDLHMIDRTGCNRRPGIDDMTGIADICC